MAVQTIYLLGTAAVTPNWWGNIQLNGSAPTAANSAFGWGPAKTAITTPYYRGRLGATGVSGTAAQAASYNAAASGPTPGTGSGTTTAGDSFIAGPFYGIFANTAWTFNCNIRAGTAGCIGHINMRVWRGANATGAGATQVTANTAGATVTLSTSADVNSSITWSPGALTLVNEYLFFQIEWQETTVGSSNNDNVLFRIGTASITTADFVQTIAGSLVATQAAQTVAATGWATALGTLAYTELPDTLAAQARSIVAGALSRLEVNDTIIAAGGPRVAGALVYTELPDTLAATGTVPSSGFTSVNVAYSGNGGVASASSYYTGANYPPANANNGSRDCTHNGAWGVGDAGWNDATSGVFPDTFDVTFAGVDTISEIDVFTLRDDYTTGGDPSPTLTFSQYGITDFDVQYWDGATFQTIQSITGNNLVWRKITFAPIATSQIHIIINDAADHTWSRLVEVEAWTAGVVVGGTLSVTESPDTLAAAGTVGTVYAHLVASYTPGSNRNDYTSVLGVRFTMTADTGVNQLGVLCASGNSGLHTVNLYRWSQATPVATAQVNLTGGTVGQFYYASIPSVVMYGGDIMLLGASETQGDGQQWADATSSGQVTMTSGVTPGSVMGAFAPSFSAVSNDTMYVGVDLITCALPPASPLGGIGGPGNLVQAYTPASGRNNYGGALGMQFTVGASPLTFNQIGHRCGQGTLRTQTLALRDMTNNVELARATITLTNAVYGNWYYEFIPSVTLVPGNTYALQGAVQSGDGYQWQDVSGNTLQGCTAWIGCFGGGIDQSPPSTYGTNGQYFGVDLNFTPWTAALTVTETPDTLAATGNVPILGINGNLAVTQANQTLASAGTVRVGSTLAVTEALDTIVAAGGPRVGGALTYPPASVWSASDALAANGGTSPTTLSNGGLDFTPTVNAYVSTLRTTVSKSSGKLYIEFYANSTGGNMGWGVANANTDPSRGMSQSNNSGSAAWYYGTTAATPGFVANYNSTLWPVSGQTIAMAVDFVNGGIWFAINNVWLNSSNPATNALPMISFVPATVGPLFAAAGPGQVSDTWTLRASFASQIYAPPGGFIAWDSGGGGQTLVAAGSVIVRGTLGLTSGNATLSAAGNSTVGGALSFPQAVQTLVAAGGPRVAGTLGVTQANHTIAAAGGPRDTATLTATQVSHTLAASGGQINAGTLTITEALDGLVAAGNSTVRGPLTVTQANQTLAGFGGEVVTGTLSQTQASQTLVGAGGQINAAFLTVTQAPQTVAATGTVRVGGTLTVTEAFDTVTAVGTVRVGAALSLTQAPQAFAGGGVVIPVDTVTLAVTQAAHGLVAAGTVRVSGALARTEGGDTLAAAGSVLVTGALTFQQACQTHVITGGPRVGAVLALIQDSQIVTITGGVTVGGGLSQTQANQTLHAAADNGVEARVMVLA